MLLVAGTLVTLLVLKPFAAGQQCGAALAQVRLLKKLPSPDLMIEVDSSIGGGSPANGTSTVVVEGGVQFMVMPTKEAAFSRLQGLLSRPALVLASILVGAAIVSTIVLLYWRSGALVTCRIIAYVASLASIRLSVKIIYVWFGLPYPKFLTACHFLASSLAAWAILHWRQERRKSYCVYTLRDVFPGWWPSLSIFGLQIVPIAVSFAVAVGADNMALVFATVAFTEILSSTQPACTAVAVCSLGMPFHRAKWLPTLLVILGCVVSTTGEVNFSAWGLICGLIANFSRVSKSVLQQRLLTGDTRDQCEPVTLLFWMCIPSFVMMALWSLLVDGLVPYQQFSLKVAQNPVGLSATMVLSCLNACLLNTLGLYCIRDLGAVGMQLTGQLKSILGVLASIVLFGDQVSKMEALGFVCVLIGVYWYQRTPDNWKQAAQAQPPAQPPAVPLAQDGDVRQ